MNNYFDNEPSKVINSRQIKDPKSGKVIGSVEKYDSGIIIDRVEGYFYDHNKNRCEVISTRYYHEDESGLYSEDNSVVVWKPDGTFSLVNTAIKFCRVSDGRFMLSGEKIEQVRISSLFGRETNSSDIFIGYDGNKSSQFTYLNGELKSLSMHKWKRRYKRTIMSESKGYFVEKIVSRKNKFKVSVSIRDLLKY